MSTRAVSLLLVVLGVLVALGVSYPSGQPLLDQSDYLGLLLVFSGLAFLVWTERRGEPPRKG